MIQKRHIGWIAVIILSVSPIIPWIFAMQPFSLRIASSYAVFTSLGEISSLVGVAMFSLTFFLSIRWRKIEDFFGGMNRVYIAHHIFGGVALILLMIHPIFLALAYAPISFKAGIQYILPGKQWPINLGIIALMTMMGLLIVTFFVNFAYQTWLSTHKFLGLAFFIGAIHGLYVTSDISRSALMKWYMLIFLTGGLVCFTYRTLLGRFLIRRTTYIVNAIRTLPDNVVEITLKPLIKGISYLPGQFVFLKYVSHTVTNEVHPFSISSTPSDPLLMITSKAEGDYTTTLQNLKPGDMAYIEGPFGRFLYMDYGKTQIWVAGGIGITPFYSMARSIGSADYLVDLYYCVRDMEEAIYLPELQQIASSNKNFRIIPWVSKTQGRLSAVQIEKVSGNLTGQDIFICGPPPMMKSLRDQLLKTGVNKYKIHTEEFQIQ